LRYWILVVTTAFAVAGVFTVYTYITTFLTDVSRFSMHAISPVLLICGLLDVLGLACVSVVVDSSPRKTVIISIGMLVAASLGLYVFGTERIITVCLFGLVGFSLPCIVTATQSRVLQVAPGSTDVASAGTSAAFNLGIAGGALVGGLLLPTMGVRGTPLAGALLAAVALVIVLCEPRNADWSGRRAPGRGGERLRHGRLPAVGRVRSGANRIAKEEARR
jgi:MFS transporter, DHA1 family, inner membrane transport protein